MGLFKKAGKKLGKFITKTSTKLINKKDRKPVTQYIQSKAGEQYLNKVGKVVDKGLTVGAGVALASGAVLAAPALGIGAGATKGVIGAGAATKSSIAGGVIKGASKLDRLKKISSAIDKGQKIAGNIKKTTTLLNRRDVTPGSTEPEISMIPEQFLPGGLPAGDLQDKPSVQSPGVMQASFPGFGEINPLVIGAIILALIVLMFASRNNG